jgi:hypothetical protein
MIKVGEGKRKGIAPGGGGLEGGALAEGGATASDCRVADGLALSAQMLSANGPDQCVIGRPSAVHSKAWPHCHIRFLVGEARKPRLQAVAILKLKLR